MAVKAITQLSQEKKRKELGLFSSEKVKGQEGNPTALPVPTEQSQGRWKYFLQSGINRSRSDWGGGINLHIANFFSENTLKY